MTWVWVASVTDPTSGLPLGIQVVIFLVLVGVAGLQQKRVSDAQAALAGAKADGEKALERQKADYERQLAALAKTAVETAQATERQSVALREQIDRERIDFRAQLDARDARILRQQEDALRQERELRQQVLPQLVTAAQGLKSSAQVMANTPVPAAAGTVEQDLLSRLGALLPRLEDIVNGKRSSGAP